MAVPSLQSDEFHGVGGEYLLNPKTGKRTLIQRTEPAQLLTPDEVLSDADSESQTHDSGED